MKKIKVMKSIEGGEYKEVIIDKVVFDTLCEYDEVANTFTFLMTRNLLNDTVEKGLRQIYKDCENIFKQYGLDKYDIRAHYKDPKTI
jgi:hypothetical protein